MQSFDQRGKVSRVLRRSWWEGVRGDFEDENVEGSEGRRWVRGREESGSERGFGGLALMGKAFEGG